MQQFLDWIVTSNEKWTLYNNQLRGETKKKFQSTFQSQTCTKKRSWSLFSGLLPVWSTTAFWVPTKPSHLRNMLSKSMRCTENCNTYSRHWSTGRAQFFSITMPDCPGTTDASKVEWIGLQSSVPSTISHLTSHQWTT